MLEETLTTHLVVVGLRAALPHGEEVRERPHREAERLGQRLRVLRRDQDPGLAVHDDLGESFDSRGHDGQPRRHRLGRDQPEPLVPRGHREEIHGPIERGHLLRLPVPQPPDRTLDPEPPRLSLQRRPGCAVADDHHLAVRVPPQDRGQRCQEHDRRGEHHERGSHGDRHAPAAFNPRGRLEAVHRIDERHVVRQRKDTIQRRKDHQHFQDHVVRLEASGKDLPLRHEASQGRKTPEADDRQAEGERCQRVTPGGACQIVNHKRFMPAR